jgi:hypothetical protein
MKSHAWISSHSFEGAAIAVLETAVANHVNFEVSMGLPQRGGDGVLECVGASVSRKENVHTWHRGNDTCLRLRSGLTAAELLGAENRDHHDRYDDHREACEEDLHPYGLRRNGRGRPKGNGPS